MYGVIHFFRYKKCFSDYIENLFSYRHFNNIEIDNFSPSELLTPFFYYNAPDPSFISEFFRKYFCYNVNSFDNFISILSDKDSFKTLYLYYIFPDTDNIEDLLSEKDFASKLFAAASKISSDKTIINYFLILFYNFDEITDELIKFFNHIYPYICELHERNKVTVTNIFKKTYSPESIKIFNTLLNNKTEYKNSVISISLLNNHILFQYKNNIPFFLLGSNFNKNFIQNELYSSVTPISFFNLMGNPVRYKIIEKLKKYQEPLTVTQLSRMLNMPSSTVRKNINILIAEMFISIKIEPREIYYSINKNYYSHLEGKLYDYFTSFFS